MGPRRSLCGDLLRIILIGPQSTRVLLLYVYVRVCPVIHRVLDKRDTKKKQKKLTIIIIIPKRYNNIVIMTRRRVVELLHYVLYFNLYCLYVCKYKKRVWPTTRRRRLSVGFT